MVVLAGRFFKSKGKEWLTKYTLPYTPITHIGQASFLTWRDPYKMLIVSP
jgi:hypothetical protein